VNSIKELEIVIIVLVVLSLLLQSVIIFKKKDDKEIKSFMERNNGSLDNKFSNMRLELSQLFTNLQTTLLNILESKLNDSSQKEIEKIDMLIKTIETFLKEMKVAVENNTVKTEIKLEKINETLEKQIKSLETENSKKLDEMRNVVDEKLQKTLETRLANSFKQVTDNLEKVYQGLGEMQHIASGVSDLKKVLSNVKTRGILGETQLSAILEQILSPEQYDINVITKEKSKDPVEFAIKMPGDDQNFVYLPIDAKFPVDSYSKLLTAYDTGNVEEIKMAKNELVARIKRFGKDIHEKYVEPPRTTDFAIMFLPVEGLYAEVVQTGVTEDLQRDYKINVAGPSTMAALLNSLQMGFKTLAIQKRSGEVWKVLSAVKTEFSTFQTVLEGTQNKLNQATNELEKLVGVRTRQIQRKLDGVMSIPEHESKQILDIKE